MVKAKPNVTALKLEAKALVSETLEKVTDEIDAMEHLAKMEPLPKPNKTAILGKLKAFEAIVVGRLNDTLHSKDGF